MDFVRSWWELRLPFYGLGAVAGLLMVWLPYQTHLDNVAWGERLRQEGAPAQAVVYDLEHQPRNSNTMHLRYDAGGARHWTEVPCEQVCHPAGTPVAIWVSPADPSDFVTDFGVLSGHRGRVQGGIGVVGFVLFVSMALLTLDRLSRRRRDRRIRR
ncbi:hypothetical protein Q0Z83_048740 [Actinoplanes sichuanensis]|uniref:DUF3592 domain-containing protein n=1 Tax=Actinoplanes sichuanensis TaxID=512349 RepID=A0ABW4AQM9_9ACTN|nr:DUF3592 domain-containing protein [Actinoplanes sichuanensis]BEL06683.1 hypothetical protein Q0Z83_048740 [Actinoplanes sichuanensis]